MGGVECFGVLRLRCAPLRMTGCWCEEEGRERAYIPTHDDEACHGWGTRSFWAIGGEQAKAEQMQRQKQVLRLRGLQMRARSAQDDKVFVGVEGEQATAKTEAGPPPAAKDDKQKCEWWKVWGGRLRPRLAAGSLRFWSWLVRRVRHCGWRFGEGLQIPCADDVEGHHAVCRVDHNVVPVTICGIVLLKDAPLEVFPVWGGGADIGRSFFWGEGFRKA